MICCTYRSASLRVRGLGGPRVTFSDTHTMCRYSCNCISNKKYKLIVYNFCQAIVST